MRKLQLQITCLLFMVGSAMLFAQKVHYKGGYYTLVNQKIFHRGHNVYGKLTPGQRDTIYLTAEELYDQRGKLKPHYKKRRGTDKYKLPEGYWENKAKEAAQARVAANTVYGGSVAVAENAVEQNSTSQQQSGQVVVSAQKENASYEEKSSGSVAKPQVASNIKEEKTEEENKDIAEKANDTTQNASSIQLEEAEADKKEENGAREVKETEAKENLKKAQEEQERIKDAKRASEKVEKSEKIATKADEKAEKKIYKSERKLEQTEKKAKKENKATEKTIRKEEKKLDKKEKEVKKADKELKQREKQLKAKEAAATAVTAANVATQSTSNSFGTIYFKINKQKTVVDSLGRIRVYFNIINNSDKELVLLKPNNSFESRIDFFSTAVECHEVETVSSEETATKELKITTEDYLVVQPNSSSELMMNGDYYGNLECANDDVVLKIEYNPYQIVEKGIHYNEVQRKEFNKAFEKISRIKIESENIKFELNKQ